MRRRESALPAISAQDREYSDPRADPSGLAQPRMGSEGSLKSRWPCEELRREQARSSRMLRGIRFVHQPAFAWPIVVDTAQLELALHATQLRIGYSFDRGSEIAVHSA